MARKRYSLLKRRPSGAAGAVRGLVCDCLLFGIALAACVVLANPAVANLSTCPASNTIVETVDPTLAKLACEAEASAAAMLGRCGITNGKRLTIVIHEGGVSLYDLPVFGAYEVASRTLHLGQMAETQRLMRGHPALSALDPVTFYRSIVVHETAHAVSQDWLAGARPSILAAEYVAFVVQFALMPRGLRDEILAHYPASGPVSLNDFRMISLVLDPFSFGATAHRHYGGLADPCRWLRGLLDGSIVMPGAAE